MDKDQAREDLKRVREERGVPKTLLKQQGNLKRTRKQLAEAFGDNAMTVPQLASAIDTPTQDVFWHINAMRKYGDVEIRDDVDGYLSYALVKKD